MAEEHLPHHIPRDWGEADLPVILPILLPALLGPGFDVCLSQVPNNPSDCSVPSKMFVRGLTQ